MQDSLRAMFLGVAILSAVGAGAQKPVYVRAGGNADGLRAGINTFFAWGQRETALNVPAVAGAAVREAAAELPDAPMPQGAAAGDFDLTAGQSTSSSQTGSQQQPADGAQSQHDKAAQQIKKQESQRAFGIVPSFNTSFTGDVVPLSRTQKMGLAFRTSIDPFTFAEAALIGGYRELGDNYSGYGWGAQGYGKRFGSAYADSFLGNMIGNGFLPGVLHQEPRYFQLGHGNFFHRFAYAAAAAVRCRHDGTNRWEPNYSNVAGNIIAGAISNVYYPDDQRGWEHTFGDGLVNTATGIIGTEFQEFWVDIAKKLPRKDKKAQP
jgi:hypothetical protein